MNDSFLPQGYEIPKKAGTYMSFEQGENRFRILDHAHLGYEWWTDTPEGRKPVRVRMGEKVPVLHAEDYKHFWVMPVWNYEAKKVQLLKVTQKTIQIYIKALAANKKWGSPTEYDLIVTRVGEGMETEYTIVADPKETMSKEMIDEYAHMKINWDAYFESKDPFSLESHTEQMAEDAMKALGENND